MRIVVELSLSSCYVDIHKFDFFRRKADRKLHPRIQKKGCPIGFWPLFSAYLRSLF
jgi:hypothetical protein